MRTHLISRWLAGFACAWAANLAFTSLSVAQQRPEAAPSSARLVHQLNQLSVGAESIGGTAEHVRAPRIGIVLPEDENDDAWVTEVVPDSPAAMAGIMAGDTITKLDGKSIKSAKQFREAIKAHKPGDEVKFTVRRDTKTLVLTVKLGGDTVSREDVPAGKKSMVSLVQGETDPKADIVANALNSRLFHAFAPTHRETRSTRLSGECGRG